MANSYVVGLMFSPDKTKVVLIQKNRPEWQKDKLNGIGGKKEKTDFNLNWTMSREFEEETGVDTRPEDWNKIVTLSTSEGVIITFFKCFSDRYKDVKTITDEKVAIVSIEGIMRYALGEKCKMLVVNNGKEEPDEIDFKLLNNIPWIILLAFDKDISKVEGQTVNQI